jgi:cytochrome c oxidase subunit 3
MYEVAFKEGSRHLDIVLGSVNTGVLICSSLMMALAVHATRVGNRRRQVLFLLATIVLGVIFLGIKFTEYYQKYVEHLIPGHGFQLEGANGRHAQLFFSLYFAMTGMHAVHMIIGICLLSIFAVLSWKGRFTPEHYSPVEIMGLYWHFVDIIWVYLFPLLYLDRN